MWNRNNLPIIVQTPGGMILMSKRKAKEMFMKIIEAKKHITFTPWMLRIFGRIE
jgi:hypothetical protein